MVENDSTCAAIGEFWAGRIPSANDFATVYMAAGFGLGLVTNGDVYRGSSSNVGEIGHMVLDVNGPPAGAAARAASRAWPRRPRSSKRAEEDSLGLVNELALRGRRTAVRLDFAKSPGLAAAGPRAGVQLIEESATYLAKALLSVTNLLDLDQIILAGPGFSGGGRHLRPHLAGTWISRLVVRPRVHPTRVELSRSSASPRLGAASLVLHSRLTPHQTSSRLALAAH